MKKHFRYLIALFSFLTILVIILSIWGGLPLIVVIISVVVIVAGLVGSVVANYITSKLAEESMGKEYFEKFRSESIRNLDRLSSRMVDCKYYIERSVEDEIYDWLEKTENGFAIVYGIAGIGKTNLLCNIAREYLEKDYPVLFIEADRLDRYIKVDLENKPIGDSLTLIEKIIKNKKILILLDALDLIAYNRGSKELVDFVMRVRQCDKSLILATIRTPEFEILREKRVIIDKIFPLPKFNIKEVKEFTVRKKKPIKLSYPNIKFFQIPLFLNRIYDLYKEEDEIPSYIDFFIFYNDIWDKQVKNLREGALPDYEEPDRDYVKNAKEALVYRVAFKMFRNRRTRLHKSTLEKHISSVKRGYKAYQDLISERIVLEHIGIIEFFHQTFLEYTTARYLVRRLERDESIKIVKELNLDDPFYRGIIEYLAGLGKRENTEIYKEVIDLLVASPSHFQHIISTDIFSGLKEWTDYEKEKIKAILKTDKDLVDYILGLMISESWTPDEGIFDTLEDLAKHGDWEIKRRIAEALPTLAKIGIQKTTKIMEILRDDWDEKWKTDIRRRVVEAVPALMREGYKDVKNFLQVKDDDEVYTIIALTEVLSDFTMAIIEAISNTKQQIGPNKSSKLIEDLISKVGDKNKNVVTWLLKFLDQIKFDSNAAIENAKQIVYKGTPSLILGKGDDAYRICIARNISRLIDKYPDDVLEITAYLTRPKEHVNVRRPICRALPDLINFIEVNPEYKTKAENIIWALAIDTDEIIPVTLTDNYANMLKVLPEITKKIVLYYIGKEGEKTLKYFSEKGRTHMQRRTKEILPRLIEFFPEIQEEITNYINMNDD